MNKQTTKIKVGDKYVSFSFKNFEEEIDLDTLLRIDMRRLPAEIITFPVVLNRMGLLLADAENAVKESQLNLEIFISSKREEIRLNLLEQKSEGVKMTQDDMKIFQESALRKDGKFLVKNKIVFRAQKNYDYLKSVYWSAKDKSDKLSGLLEKIGKEEIDFNLDSFGSNINGVDIRISKPLI